jgi:hypothetical protein
MDKDGTGKKTQRGVLRCPNVIGLKQLLILRCPISTIKIEFIRSGILRIRLAAYLFLERLAAGFHYA